MKYRISINIIGHRLEEDKLNELITSVRNDFPCHEDYSNFHHGGFMEMTSEITQNGKDLRWDIVYSGEGKMFEERHIKMKKLVESGELQRSMMYECESDIHIPSAKRKARRITATIMRIE